MAEGLEPGPLRPHGRGLKARLETVAFLQAPRPLTCDKYEFSTLCIHMAKLPKDANGLSTTSAFNFDRGTAVGIHCRLI